MVNQNALRIPSSTVDNVVKYGETYCVYPVQWSPLNMPDSGGGHFGIISGVAY